jgi:hypothetical protein
MDGGRAITSVTSYFYSIREKIYNKKREQKDSENVSKREGKKKIRILHKGWTFYLHKLVHELCLDLNCICIGKI